MKISNPVRGKEDPEFGEISIYVAMEKILSILNLWRLVPEKTTGESIQFSLGTGLRVFFVGSEKEIRLLKRVIFYNHFINDQVVVENCRLEGMMNKFDKCAWDCAMEALGQCNSTTEVFHRATTLAIFWAYGIDRSQFQDLINVSEHKGLSLGNIAALCDIAVESRVTIIQAISQLGLS